MGRLDRDVSRNLRTPEHSSRMARLGQRRLFHHQRRTSLRHENRLRSGVPDSDTWRIHLEGSPRIHHTPDRHHPRLSRGAVARRLRWTRHLQRAVFHPSIYTSAPLARGLRVIALPVRASLSRLEVGPLAASLVAYGM